MSPDSRAAQSTVLLATLSTGSGAEPRGCGDPETLGDGICNVSTVVCERVAKLVFSTIDLTNSTFFGVFSHVCTFVHSDIRDILRTRWCVECAWSKGMLTPAYSALCTYGHDAIRCSRPRGGERGCGGVVRGRDGRGRSARGGRRAIVGGERGRRAARRRAAVARGGGERARQRSVRQRARARARERRRRHRARCEAAAHGEGGQRYPGCLSVPPPPKSPDPPPPPTIPSKPPRSSSPGTTMLGQSPLTRAHCGGGGACSLARSRALVVAVTFCSVRLHRPSRAYARARVRHQRASRASSPFSVPPPRTHARAATALACSLARSRARARAVRLRCGRSHRPSRALRAPRVTRALAYVITAHRARHRRFPSPRARPARAPCSGGGAHSRTLDCARAVWRW